MSLALFGGLKLRLDGRDVTERLPGRQGRALRGAVYLLGVQLVGIMSPIVLLPGRLFAGPHGAPTLEGQYVLKDVIIVGAALVLAATLGGGRLAATAPRDESA
jgi:hypothetical protein